MENEKTEKSPSNENEIQNVEKVEKKENQNKINDNQNDIKNDNNNNNNNDINDNKIQDILQIKTNIKSESNELTQQILYEECDSDNSALSNSEISENDIDSITTRTSSNKDMDLDTFYKQSRQFFIMTEGGTPIYSRYGDEIKNCSLSATFSAIITKYVAFNGGTNNENERLNYIKNEYSLIVFMKKGKLFLISVSNKNDSVSFLYRQLQLLYNQLLSVITNDRMKILEEKPATFAKLLTNSNCLFEQTIEYTSHSMVGILKSYQVLPIENRIKLNEICSRNRGDALATILITLNAKEIIALSKLNSLELSFSDIALIQCLIMSRGSLKENECWVPLCLPGISADGFLQLYINFLPPNQYGILFLVEKQEQTSFNTYYDLSRRIHDEIKEKGLLSYIEKAIETKNNAEYIKEDIQNDTQEINVELLKEFIKKTFSNKNSGNNNNNKESLNPNDIISKSTNLSEAYRTYQSNIIKKGNTNIHNSRIISVGKIAMKQGNKNDPILKINYGLVQHRFNSQYFTINMHSHDHLTKEEKYILKSYIKLYDYYISFSDNLSNPGNFYHIEKDNKFSHGLYVNDPILIFGTFNLFKPNDEIVAILKESIKIIKQNESNFFVSLK